MKRSLVKRSLREGDVPSGACGAGFTWIIHVQRETVTECSFAWTG